jgi:hypothetical protein
MPPVGAGGSRAFRHPYHRARYEEAALLLDDPSPRPGPSPEGHAMVAGAGSPLGRDAAATPACPHPPVRLRHHPPQRCLERPVPAVSASPRCTRAACTATATSRATPWRTPPRPPPPPAAGPAPRGPPRSLPATPARAPRLRHDAGDPLLGQRSVGPRQHLLPEPAGRFLPHRRSRVEPLGPPLVARRPGVAPAVRRPRPHEPAAPRPRAPRRHALPPGRPPQTPTGRGIVPPAGSSPAPST